MEKLYSVFSFEKAQIMLGKGFKVVNIAKNSKNSKFIVFYFQDTEEFRKAFKEI